MRAADAVAVIALYEHTMVAMFGPAFMAPPPPITCLDPQQPLHSQVCIFIWYCEKINKINQFIFCFLCDYNINCIIIIPENYYLQVAHDTKTNIECTFALQVDDYMGEFCCWLKRYTQALLGESEE